MSSTDAVPEPTTPAPPTDPSEQLVGYRVEAVDGTAGTIDQASTEVDPEHLVVATPGLVHHKVVVEADAIRKVRHDEQVVEVDRVKEWVKQSPRLKQYQETHE